MLGALSEEPTGHRSDDNGASSAVVSRYVTGNARTKISSTGAKNLGSFRPGFPTASRMCC